MNSAESSHPNAACLFNIGALCAVIAMALLASGCESEPLTPSKASEPPRWAWIASWKSIEVREPVFVRSYVRYASTLPVSDDLSTRKAFALELLKREVIAHQALHQGVGDLAEIKEAVEVQRSIEMARQFVRERVTPGISAPGEEDLRTAFRRSNTRVELEQIFSPTKEGIDSLNTMLREGEDFDVLASASMRAAGQPSGAWKMGWVEWNQMNLASEVAAFDLEIGEVTAPVNSLSGWHIFRLTNKQETFFADASTFQNAREGIELMLVRRKIEEASARFVDSIRAASPSPVIYISAIRSLIERIRQSGAFRDPNRIYPTAVISDVVFAEERVAAVQGDDGGQDTLFPETLLAEWNGHRITAGDFISWMKTYPSAMVLDNPLQVVESILMDLHFAQLGERAGLGAHPEVVLQTHLVRINALNQAIRELVADTLDPSRIAAQWQNRWMRDFVEDIRVEVESVALADSLGALEWMFSTRNSLDQAQGKQAEDASKRKLERFEVSLGFPEPADSQITAILRKSPKESGWLGPVQHKGRWIAIRHAASDTVWMPEDRRRELTLQRITQNLSDVAGEEILEQIGFRSEHVRFNEKAIRTALPLYFE